MSATRFSCPPHLSEYRTYVTLEDHVRLEGLRSILLKEANRKS